jgi:hypothetical protein
MIYSVPSRVDKLMQKEVYGRALVAIDTFRCGIAWRYSWCMSYVLMMFVAHET